MSHTASRRASYSRRQHELLERANDAGRTRVRCRTCDAPISGRPDGLWADDDGSSACQGQAYERLGNDRPIHLP